MCNCSVVSRGGLCVSVCVRECEKLRDKSGVCCDMNNHLYNIYDTTNLHKLNVNDSVVFQVHQTVTAIFC